MRKPITKCNLKLQTTDDEALTITPTNNSNVFGVHIKANLVSSESSETFDLLALFDAKRYGALCIDSVPMCSMCLATCAEIQEATSIEEEQGNNEQS